MYIFAKHILEVKGQTQKKKEYSHVHFCKTYFRGKRPDPKKLSLRWIR